jgi:hypothetical protein
MDVFVVVVAVVGGAVVGGSCTEVDVNEAKDVSKRGSKGYMDEEGEL